MSLACGMNSDETDNNDQHQKDSRMNKFVALIAAAALALGLGISGTAMAASEAVDSPSTHVLDSDGSMIDFNSAFCEVGVPNDPVTVSLTNSSGGDADGLTITGLALRNSKGTPSKSKGGGKRNPTFDMNGTAFGGTSIDIRVLSFDGGKSAHFGLILSNGDVLGVNLHTNSCDLV